MEFAVSTKELSKRYDDRFAVQALNMTVPTGSVHGIIGANGAGKSTLLRMLVGLVVPNAGHIEVLGEPMSAKSAALRQRVHYLGSEGEVYRSFRIEDVLKYARLTYQRWDQNRCNHLMDALELPPKRLMRNLSLGMQMQVRLLIALSARPEVLLLDEPTNGLDPVVKRQFLQLIVQEVAGSGMTVLLATHHLADLERLADGITVLYRGKTVVTGQLEALRERVKRVQAVLPMGEPQTLSQNSAIVEREQRGQFYSYMVEGGRSPAEAVEHALKEAGALYTEIVDIGLEALFEHIMKKEGYVRDGILLS